MELTVEVKGVEKLAEDLRDLGIKRIPNYVARSLTLLADRVQDAMIEEAQGKLTVRGTWLRKGTRFGINRKAATKGDLTASVSTSARWLVAEEADAERRASSGNILIPLYAVRQGREDSRVIARRYNALTRNKSNNLIKLTNKKGQTILYEHGTKVSRHFLPLFMLKRSAPIPKRVHLLPVAEKKVQAMYLPVMREMIQRAIDEQGG